MLTNLVALVGGLFLLVPLGVHTIRFKKVSILLILFFSLPLLLSTLIVLLLPTLPVLWWLMAAVKTVRPRPKPVVLPL